MNGLFEDYASVVQLHTLSIDLAAHVMNESDGPSSLSNATLSSFAAMRRQASEISSEEFHKQPLALPPPDTKRRARQAALRRARAARVEDPLDQEAGIAPVVSINELSSGSDAGLTTQSSTSSGTDGLAGPLRKRGRKTKIQRKRHFVLVGSTLYNYRSKRDTKPSWKLNLIGAEVGTDSVSCRIVIFLDGGRQLVLYARTPREVEVWGNALARATEGITEFHRNNSPTCVTHQRFDQPSDDDRRAPSVDMSETDVVDMARMVKENGDWDSFRSFSALQMRTTWKRQE